MSNQKKFLRNPLMLFFSLGHRECLNWMSDEQYLKIGYWIKFKRKLNLDNPLTFNEKLQWLKLYDRNPLYTQLVDKYVVKNIVAEKIGAEYIIPTLGVWNQFDEIDFDKLPDQFVLKTTHDSGSVVICKNKEYLDLKSVKNKIDKSLRKNFYCSSREWPYKNVPHCIIAEKFMNDGEHDFLPVYKFFCFNGKPKIIQTIQNDKQPNETIDYFDIKWNLLDLRQNYPNSKTPYEKPLLLNKMLEIAEILSKGHSFIRVDLYTINNRIYFSEYTFYSDSGLAPFKPNKWDDILGNWINLPSHN